HRDRAAGPRPHGCGPDLAPPRGRSAGTRPPLLVGLVKAPGAGLEALEELRRGARRDGRVVPGKPPVVGAAQVGRAPGVLRETVRRPAPLIPTCRSSRARAPARARHVGARTVGRLADTESPPCSGRVAAACSRGCSSRSLHTDRQGLHRAVLAPPAAGAATRLCSPRSASL